jgi:lipopolysaccharide export system protein LptA
LSRDQVELRSGRVVQGDVLSVTMTTVAMRIDGQDQTFDRNQVRQIILVQRETFQQTTLPQAVPAPPKQ